LAVIDLTREVKAEHRSKAAADEDKVGIDDETGIKTGKYIRYIIWLVGFSLAIYLVGFVIATPVFVVAYMKRHGASWFAGITTAVIYTIIIYVVFNFTLKADLYKGIILIGLDF